MRYWIAIYKIMKLILLFSLCFILCCVALLFYWSKFIRKSVDAALNAVGWDIEEVLDE